MQPGCDLAKTGCYTLQLRLLNRRIALLQLSFHCVSLLSAMWHARCLHDILGLHCSIAQQGAAIAARKKHTSCSFFLLMNPTQPHSLLNKHFENLLCAAAETLHGNMQSMMTWYSDVVAHCCSYSVLRIHVAREVSARHPDEV